MSVKGKRVIFAAPADKVDARPTTVEGVATEAGILPGSLVKFAAAGAGLEIYDAAATVDGVEVLIANKDEQRYGSVDDAWTINENMVALKPESGQAFNVLVAAGQNITSRGTPLASNGAGALVIATPATDVELFYAQEIINTGGAAALVLCVPA